MRKLCLILTSVAIMASTVATAQPIPVAVPGYLVVPVTIGSLTTNTKPTAPQTSDPAAVNEVVAVYGKNVFTVSFTGCKITWAANDSFYMMLKTDKTNAILFRKDRMDALLNAAKGDVSVAGQALAVNQEVCFISRIKKLNMS